jgi:predicted nucleic acid-binding protein
LILVDTNVLLDILRDDQQWELWSAAALTIASTRDALAINPVIYAELSSQHDTIEALDFALEGLDLAIAEIPKPALFLAGQAFKRYRRSGGTKANVLADFFIGAHAAVAGAPLLTRDTRRIRSYFPTVEIIEPVLKTTGQLTPSLTATKSAGAKSVRRCV